IRGGELERVGLGVRLAPDTVAKRSYRAQGAMVQEVVPGFGAAAAGLRSMEGTTFDDIVAIADQPVRDANDVFEILSERVAGEVVPVEVLRGGERRRFEVKLQPLNPR
ncbi:MAG: PDZ domain-containing protein, partial [Planctomycetota bacterium]